MLNSPTYLDLEGTAILTFVGAFECDCRHGAPNYGKIPHPEHHPPQIPPL